MGGEKRGQGEEGGTTQPTDQRLGGRVLLREEVGRETGLQPPSAPPLGTGCQVGTHAAQQLLSPQESTQQVGRTHSNHTGRQVAVFCGYSQDG